MRAARGERAPRREKATRRKRATRRETAASCEKKTDRQEERKIVTQRESNIWRKARNLVRGGPTSSK